MVRLALVLASLLAFAGCTSNCQELGNRLCQCLPVGTTSDACQNAVKSDVQRANPGKSAEAECAKALDTCHAPLGPDGKEEAFCDFLAGRCGKSLCRISAESYCDADVCDATIYCKPSLCGGAAAVTAADGTPPAICTAALCPDTACDAAACPAASQPATCTTP
jgi:hypothetical protein